MIAVLLVILLCILLARLTEHPSFWKWLKFGRWHVLRLIAKISEMSAGPLMDDMCSECNLLFSLPTYFLYLLKNDAASDLCNLRLNIVYKERPGSSCTSGSAFIQADSMAPNPQAYPFFISVSTSSVNSASVGIEALVRECSSSSFFFKVHVPLLKIKKTY